MVLDAFSIQAITRLLFGYKQMGVTPGLRLRNALGRRGVVITERDVIKFVINS